MLKPTDTIFDYSLGFSQRELVRHPHALRRNIASVRRMFIKHGHAKNFTHIGKEGDAIIIKVTTRAG